MAQATIGTIDTSVVDGVALARLLENAGEAYRTMHSGPNRPTYATAGMVWIDTTSTINELKYYDGAQDIVIATIDTNLNKPRLVLDADQDTYLIAGARDDEIELVVQGNKKMVFSATGIRVGDGNSPTISFDTNATDAIQVPAGTTAQRPSNGAGRLRWNTTTTKLEFNNGTTWAEVGTGTGGGVTLEQVRDEVGRILTQGNNITITVDDNNDTITISSQGGTGGGVTLEQVNDQIGVVVTPGKQHNKNNK